MIQRDPWATTAFYGISQQHTPHKPLLEGSRWHNFIYFCLFGQELCIICGIRGKNIEKYPLRTNQQILRRNQKQHNVSAIFPCSRSARLQELTVNDCRVLKCPPECDTKVMKVHWVEVKCDAYCHNTLLPPSSLTRWATSQALLFVLFIAPSCGCLDCSDCHLQTLFIAEWLALASHLRAANLCTAPLWANRCSSK